MDLWLLAPIVMALCDVVENIIHFGLIKGWSPSNAAILIFTLAALTTWLLLVAVVVRLVTLGFPAIHFGRKKDPPT